MDLHELLTQALRIQDEANKNYAIAKNDYVAAGGDPGFLTVPIEAARPYYRAYLDMQFIAMSCSDLVQTIKRAMESQPMEWELRCNRCGKIGKEGKVAKDYCDQTYLHYFQDRTLKPATMLCRGQLYESIKSPAKATLQPSASTILNEMLNEDDTDK